MFCGFWLVIVAFQGFCHFKNLVRVACVTFNTSADAIYVATACTLVLQLFETSGFVAIYFTYIIDHEYCDNSVLHQKGLLSTWIWPKFALSFCTFCEKAD